MSRIRTIKPEFFKSRSLAKVPALAMLTFAGLWCEADDAGNGIADADLLKGALWPKRSEISSHDVEEHLQALSETGHISFYEVDQERYYSVTNWTTHQSSTYRRSPPQFPLPPAIEQPSLFEDGELREGSRSLAKVRAGTWNMEHGREHGTRKPNFDRFWAIYPRREGKAKARDAFVKACRTATEDDICDGAQRSAAYWADHGTEHRFIPYPATWLNQERWQDDYTSNGHRPMTRGQRSLRRLGLLPDGPSSIVDTTTQEAPDG